ncbi:MAG TPA: type II toxin-antitoxin system VapC family toxin [Steroidobacteraceae bacterium]|nr:type II toxin-antitoxin system VapC family toxin [Steroidobacteraceae bacterium]
MTWLLDADVLSQPAKKKAHAGVIAWLEREKDNCYTSSIVVAQLAFWVRSKRGKQREALQGWLTRLIEAMHGRILGFNVSVAHVWAEQQHSLERGGRLMPVEDSYIAAIARRHNLTVVTGNEKDFQRPGIKVFNPFTHLPESE